MYTAPTELSNGLKFHGCRTATKDDYIYCSLNVRSGSMGNLIQGTAHFLEHLLLSFVKIYGYNKSKKLPISGKTSFDRTCFYFGCKVQSLAEAIGLIKTIISGAYLLDEYFESVRNDILAEYSHYYRIFQRECIFLSKVSENLSTFIPIGTKKSIESLTIDHVRDFYNKEYSMNNMLLSIVGDVDTRRIDDLINEPLHIIKKNPIYNKVTEFSHEKECEQTEIFIPISYPPFTICNELYDNISVALITYILKSIPLRGAIYISIKEYNKFNRFVNIRIYGGGLADEVLAFIKKGLFQSLENKISVQNIRKNIRKRLSLQMSESEILSRIEDFFVYDTSFYPISEIMSRIQYVDFESIKNVVYNLFSVTPIIVESKYNVIVRTMDDWSID